VLISYSHQEADIDESIERARRALKRALEAEVRERNSIKPYWW